MSDIEKKLSTSQELTDQETNEQVHVIIDEKKMFRKVDYRVLIIAMFTYCLQFMDKLGLSNASVFGIKKDLHLEGQDYSWASSVFFFGYMAGNFIVTRIDQKVPLGKLVAGAVFFWGITLAASAGCQNYSGLIAGRFFLGLLESVVSPTFVLMTSMWYKRSQQPVRTGIWFAGNDIGGIIGSFLAYGLGHITGSIHPWRYIFMVYGIIAFLWSFVVFFFLPDSPQKARFLTADEKEYYRTEMVQSEIKHEWNWQQAKEFSITLPLKSLC
ncbi:unnamed protein product [Ambrosiozyma monospora]|uniref:Unnamed protein product n=1 Tax=Ambrosiozyma monospora TaxID=43982 RepID=A0ACB5TRN9_AMBMO|nr:unnamed protein product [Ambrosiozyma monospora]